MSTHRRHRKARAARAAMAPLPLRMSWKSVTARRPIFFGRRSLHTYIFIYFAAYINDRRRSAGGLSWSLHTHYEDSWALPIEFSQNQVSTERSRKVEQRQMCLENRVSDLKILKIFACGAQESRLATLACYHPLGNPPRHLGGSAVVQGNLADTALLAARLHLPSALLF